MTLNEDWTADVVGQMHKYRISNVVLAQECGFDPSYTSLVLNGRRSFANEHTKAATKEKIQTALASLIKRVEAEVDADAGD